MTDFSTRNDGRRSIEGDAPQLQQKRTPRWIPWAAPGAWLQIRRAAVDADLAFQAAKARGGSRAEAASAAYKALTGEALPLADGDDGDAESVRRVVDTGDRDGEPVERDWRSGNIGLPATARRQASALDHALAAFHTPRNSTQAPADTRVLALCLAAFALLVVLGFAVSAQRGGPGVDATETASALHDEMAARR